MKLLLLDAAGVVVALALGLLVYYFGGPNGLAYLALILVFLFASVLATKYGSQEKRKLALYEYDRGWENVLANGIVPALCVLANPGGGLAGAYIGSLAAVTSDKFASEIGVLGDSPRRLFDFQPAKRGVSGAVSAVGTFFSFNGALVIGIACYFLFPGKFDAWGVLAIALIGMFGSVVDSVFGVYENRGIGNKMTTNFICAVIGAVLGYLFL
jgi:uncharacterized protein (TIGR00297 family)